MIPASKITRAEAHKVLDAYFDAMDRSDGANTPDNAAKARSEGFEYWRQLLIPMGKDLMAERLGAARAARSFHTIGPEHSAEAVAQGKLPVPKISEIGQNHNLAAAQRRMIASFVFDVSELLPPELAQNIATDMYLLNFGGTTPLSTPLRIKGMGNVGPRHVATVSLAGWVYYHKGYRRQSINKVLQSLPSELSLSQDALLSKVSKLHLQPFCKAQEAQGIEDSKSGRREDYELACDWEIERLAQFAAFLNLPR